MEYTKEYVEKKLKELEDLKAYINNPCLVCGPNNWSMFICDDCSESFYDEVEDLRDV